MGLGSGAQRAQIWAPEAQNPRPSILFWNFRNSEISLRAQGAGILSSEELVFWAQSSESACPSKFQDFQSSEKSQNLLMQADRSSEELISELF